MEKQIYEILYIKVVQKHDIIEENSGDDTIMPSLILEGGTFRPIFSAGVMDALLDEDLMFPYVIGVSAGICDGFSYISKQRERNLQILLNHRNDSRYVGKKNLLKEHSLFGLDFVYNVIPNKLYPFDWETFHQYDGKILVGVTNAQTGHIEYKDGKKLDKKCTMLRATCALPLVFPSIDLDGAPYYDGGIADPIPIRKAIKDGNDKHLIILTRPEGYKKELSRSHKVTARILKKKYPKLPELLLNRHTRYNHTVAFCEQLERDGKAIVLRPEYPIDSMESDIDVLKSTYDMGTTWQRIESETSKVYGVNASEKDDNKHGKGGADHGKNSGFRETIRGRTGNESDQESDRCM